MNQLLDIDQSDPLAVRDRTMMEIMYGAGLRLSELVGIDRRHLDLEAGEVWVTGKGSKERRLPIGTHGGGMGAEMADATRYLRAGKRRAVRLERG